MSDRKGESKFQTLHCDKCKDWLKLEFKKFDETVDGIHIIIPDMPILVCSSCGEEYQPNWTKGFVQWIVEESKTRGTTLCKGKKREAYKIRYELCKDVNFKYDASDCKFIPGLQSGFTKEGFFTPVFFDRKVLHKYLSFDEYRVDIAGNTYGTIFHNDNHWYLSFGINRNGKVFCWLGDLEEKIPQKERQYLLSENIESDHDVASEFYAATREAKFAELSNESALLKARSSFEELCKSKFKFRIFDYEKDEYDILGELIRPVNWNEKGVIHIINGLTKLCIEAIHDDALKKEIRSLDREFDMKEMKGLKLLEKWIELRSKTLDAHDVMKPFFVLYDFRIVLDHKMSENKIKEKKESCYNRLEIKEKKDYESLYDKLIKQMTDSYNVLSNKLSKH